MACDGNPKSCFLREKRSSSAAATNSPSLSSATAGKIIYVNDLAEIDLSDQEYILIPGGVTIASGRGRNGSEGALIYVQEKKDFYLFKTNGDNIRITGLRFFGPSIGRETIAKDSKCIWSLHANLEVDNCEIWAWNGGGVSYRGTTAEGGRVHHCYMHHIRRDVAGFGYAIFANDN